MPDETAGAVPAQSAAQPDTPLATVPVSAERAAADQGDFGAFDRASVARKQGKPLPEVIRPEGVTSPPEAADGEAGTLDGGERVSRRQQKELARQQTIHDYEQRLAAQEHRLRELESRGARPGTPAPPAASNGQPAADAPAPETAKQRAARYLALPDAPRVDDFDTYPEFGAAQTLFIEEQRDREKAEIAEQRQQQQAQHERLITRDQTFRERLTAAKDADPAFVERLSDEAKNLGGIDHARRSGVTPGPVHIIGELLYDSPQAVPFLRAISADPSLLPQLLALPAHVARLPPQWRAKAHIDHLVTEFHRLEGRLAYEASLQAADTARTDEAPPPSSVSSAPPPAPTLTKAGRSADPVRSALERGDFAAYDAAEMARKIRQRTAGHGGRS
jgi:hypothetical protein